MAFLDKHRESGHRIYRTGRGTMGNGGKDHFNNSAHGLEPFVASCGGFGSSPAMEDNMRKELVLPKIVIYKSTNGCSIPLRGRGTLHSTDTDSAPAWRQL